MESALHYAARHFYAPALISGLEDEKTKSVAVFLTSDLPELQRGLLEWRVTGLQGTLLHDGTVAADVAPRKSQLVQTLDLQSLAQQHGQNSLLVWLTLEIGGREASRNLVMFAPPKELDLVDPALKTEVAETKSSQRFPIRRITSGAA